jgi:hypothetical protein
MRRSTMNRVEMRARNDNLMYHMALEEREDSNVYVIRIKPVIDGRAVDYDLAVIEGPTFDKSVREDVAAMKCLEYDRDEDYEPKLQTGKVYTYEFHGVIISLSKEMGNDQTDLPCMYWVTEEGKETIVRAFHTDDDGRMMCLDITTGNMEVSYI